MTLLIVCTKSACYYMTVILAKNCVLSGWATFGAETQTCKTTRTFTIDQQEVKQAKKMFMGWELLISHWVFPISVHIFLQCKILPRFLCANLHCKHHSRRCGTQ